MRKYELTTNTKMEFGRKLFQIKALVSFGDVATGDLGGYIEKEENLSHEGNAWVYDNAKVLGHAAVSGNAQVYGTALVCENARVYGDSFVYGNSWVYGDAQVYGDALVRGDAWVGGDAQVCGEARVSSDADYICFKGFGSEGRNTTMFRTKNGDIYVCCGCFAGSLRKFTEKVKKTHGSSKYAKEYLACVEVAKIHFEIGEENDK
ncbi:hypothetical protein [Ruminococcus callidus]|uniref:hypothetical protein n=1 Tax=Ruminococcus callidus TaxID=40519 RepID=UPI00399536E1